MAVKKAQFFTLDALLALVAAIAIASMIFVSLRTPSIPDATLEAFVQDSLALLEKDRRIIAATQEPAILDVFFTRTSQSICTRIIVTSNNNVLVNATKQNCGSPASPIVQHRTIVQQSTFLIARMEAWRK